MLLAVLIIFCILAIGCKTKEESPDIPSDLIKCQEPKGNICYTLYDPVCGLTQSGEWQTFSNDCVACVSKAIGYKKGECEKK